MTKRRKIWVILIGIAAILLCVLIVLLVITPQLINLETVKEEVKRQYAKDLGGEIEYEHLNMAFFPRPHVVISDIRFTIPDNILGTVESLKVYPKILPLFTGDLEIGVIHSRSPNLTIQLSDDGKQDEPPDQPFLLETPGVWLKKVMQSIPEFRIPSIAVNVRNGRVNFLKGEQRLLALQGVISQIRHRGGAIEFSAQSQSNFWENISIRGNYVEQDFKLTSQIKLNQFRLHAVGERLLPESDLKMKNAQANLTVDLQTDGPEWIQADIQGALPYLHLQRANKELKVDDIRLRAGFQFDAGHLALNILQLDLAKPRLQLAGKFKIDPEQTAIDLDLEGRQINVATAQKVALALTENSETVSKIFNILRDGDFERIMLRTRAPTWEQLADEKKLVIQGRLTGGKISVPVGSLELENVQGDAMIANGILTGENAEAQIGNSFAKKGKLSISLTKDSAPFHIEALVEADLSELPPVLASLVNDKKFQEELKLFKNVKGSAAGMLFIGEDLRDVNVKVLASDFTVSAVYQRIPYPVTVKGEAFVLDDAQITLKNCDARFGKSSLSSLSTRFEWQKTSFLDASTAYAYFDLSQLHAWLAQNPSLENVLGQIEEVTGAVSLQNAALRGPLFKPGQWQFTSSGAIQNLELRSAQLPGALTVAKGQFRCAKNRLNINKLNAQVGQSLFSGLDADIQWGKIVSLTAGAGESAINLDELSAWIRSHPDLKQHVRDVPVINGSLAFANLKYKGPISGGSNQRLNISGAIDKWHIRSAEFPTDIEVSGGEMVWRNTRFDLLETHARIGRSTINRLSVGKQWGKIPLFELHADSADIEVGELYPWLISFDALDKMFKGYKTTRGKLTLSDLDIKGPIGASKVWKFHLTGDITETDLEAEFIEAPVRIKTAHFKAKDTPGTKGANGRIDLSDTKIEWEQSRIDVQGGTTFSEDVLSFEIRMTVDQLNWDQIDQITRVEQSTTSDKKMAVQGRMDVELKNFTYNGFTWRPVQADINFGTSETRIVIRKADLCGIQFPGIFKVSTDAFELYFNTNATDQDLNTTISCLFDKQDLMAGRFNLEGEIMAKARPSEFPKSLTGQLQFSSNEGRIYRFGMLAKIFALLNVTEIYRGEVPDLKGEGFAYNTVTANGVFEDGKLVITDASIDSPSMGIAIEGNMDLIKNRVDLIVLVAPFKTVDRIVKIIPLVGNILGGNLISIPFRAIGDIGDPDVIPLSPTAVGSGLLGIMERTLKLPITIIQPVLPGSKDEPSEEKKSPNSTP